MFLGSKVRPVRGADNLTAIYERFLTSHNHICLQGLLGNNFTFYFADIISSGVK
jgi:hypothetical protein